MPKIDTPKNNNSGAKKLSLRTDCRMAIENIAYPIKMTVIKFKMFLRAIFARFTPFYSVLPLYTAYYCLKALVISYLYFFRYGLLKACNQNFFRTFLLRFISQCSHLHYQRKGIDPICVFSTLENLKQGRSDSFISPGEPNPVGHSKYKVPSNYMATDRGFNGFAYQLYQSLTQSSHNPCETVRALCARVITSLTSVVVESSSTIYMNMRQYLNNTLPPFYHTSTI